MGGPLKGPPFTNMLSDNRTDLVFFCVLFFFKRKVPFGSAIRKISRRSKEDDSK